MLEAPGAGVLGAAGAVVVDAAVVDAAPAAMRAAPAARAMMLRVFMMACEISFFVVCVPACDTGRGRAAIRRTRRRGDDHCAAGSVRSMLNNQSNTTWTWSALDEFG